MFKKCYSIYVFFIYLFLVPNGIASDYAKCTSIEINSVASADYLREKKLDSTTYLNSVKELNDKYKYLDKDKLISTYISTPDNPNDNALFIPLVYKNNFDKEIKITTTSNEKTEEGFDALSCGFNNGDYIVCESDRIENSGCLESITYKDNNGADVTKKIEDCETFNKTIELEKNGSINNGVACYPKLHICNVYKKDINNKYFSIKISAIEENTDTNDEKIEADEDFYIYKKNVIKDGNNKNCDFDVFQCDIYIRNEYRKEGKDYKNLVLRNIGDGNYHNNAALSFINDIFSGFENNYRFFVYVGSCKFSDCEKVNINGKEVDILSAPYYYKYVFNSSDDNIAADDLVYFYKKDLADNGEKKVKGNICVGYLPRCSDIDFNIKALYNNDKNSTSGGINNKQARLSFYDDVNNVNEGELWFVNNSSFFEKNCLAYNSYEDYDIGYCSDIDYDTNTLKYPDGFKLDSNNNPVCYLKSCIDLTPDELAVITANDPGAEHKYCSEYYYLENSYDFKYFPRKKPVFCSDLNEDGELVFVGNESYEYEKCLDENNVSDPADVKNCENYKTEIAYYGGGLNKKKSNCYLKNCFSLNYDEREVITKAKTSDKAAVLKLISDSDNLNRENILNIFTDNYRDGTYCQSGFFFNKNYSGFDDFDYFNLNVIPCYEFTSEQLRNFNNKRMVSFVDLIGKYNTDFNNYFCRGHYVKASSISGTSIRSMGRFLENTFIGVDETDKAFKNDSYGDFYSNFNQDTSSFSNAREISNYDSIPLNNVDFSGENSTKKKLNMANLCRYVDNSILYYDTSIDTVDSNIFYDNASLTAYVNDIIRKVSPNYNSCLNNTNFADGVDYLKKSDDCYNNNCRGNTDDSSKEDCLMNEYLYDLLIGCSKYNSTYFSPRDMRIDCTLFINGTTDDDNNKDIYSIYKDYGFTDEDFAAIRTACEASLPPVYENTAEPDTISKKIKPFNILDASKYNDNPLFSYSLNSYGVYGCTTLETKNDYTLAGVTYSSSIYGCKIPTLESSYISFGNMDDSRNIIINNTAFSDFTDNKNTSLIYLVCSRYPATIYNGVDMCGQREGSNYKDICFSFYNSNIATILRKTDGKLFVNRSSAGQRFRRNIYGRNDYVYRDIYTSGDCSTSNNNSPYYDELAAGVVTAEGIGLASPAIAACIASAAFVPFIGAIFVAVCSAAAIALSVGLNLGLRVEEFSLSLQNDLYIMNDYFVNTNRSVVKDSDTQEDERIFLRGFLTKANFTNNDNYIYRFYPRADNIQDDLKNKLEANNPFVDGSNFGTRFYYGNTTEEDIILKCKLHNLFSYKETNCDDDLGCDIEYILNKLDDKGNANGVCSLSEEDSVEKCLSATQINCLKSFGVSFYDSFVNDINFEFETKNGLFLDRFEDLDAEKVTYEIRKEDGDWVSASIVPYTYGNQSKVNLFNNAACRLNTYGDPVGTLEECRGFLYLNDSSNKFYTESQAIPRPLLTSPFFFYELVTPRNTPELFNPTITLDKYGDYFSYSNGFLDNNNLTDYVDPETTILDFYNPKLKYSYDYTNGVVDEQFENLYASENEFISEITKYNNASHPHVVTYLSEVLLNGLSLNTKNEEERKMISELVQKYYFAIYKTNTINSDGSYTPKVCLEKILKINRQGDNLNTFLDLVSCPNFNTLGCVNFDNNKDGFIALDKEVECYEREIPNLNNSFIMFPSYNMNFLNPVINVYLKPKYVSDISTIVGNNHEYYVLKEDINSISTTKDITLFGENKIQSFGLNFERSYCSKAIYDYYNYSRLLKQEEALGDAADRAKISMYKKNINAIENVVIPDCEKLNGNEAEILINEDELKTFKDTNDISKVIYKETAKVRRYNELYGGYNELCVAEADIKNILKTHAKQHNTSNDSMPYVLTYRNNNLNMDKKCVLDDISRQKNECLVDKRVYIYCDEGDLSPECRDDPENGIINSKIDIKTGKRVFVREIDCTKYLGVPITEENIKMVQACFKGGYNTYGNIYKKPSCAATISDGGENFGYTGECVPELDYSCKCQIVTQNTVYNDNLFTIREMTPREYGLCVNLEEPIVCPAVRYYDSNGKYVDNDLALGKTIDEFKENEKDYYEQHLWRTNETMFGSIPSVFFTKTLRNAEFPSSIFCGADTNDFNSELCVDSNNGVVSGECLGYWKEGTIKPQAVCKAYNIEKDNKNITVYEYKLRQGNCERYTCKPLAYQLADEKDIFNNNPNYFTEDEINLFSTIKQTDYRSYKHNEEVDYNSVDNRGNYNGFAAWPEQVSGDFAVVVNSSLRLNSAGEVVGNFNSCLTGFGPAGSNYILYNYMPNDSYVANYTNYRSSAGDHKIDYNNLSSDLTRLLQFYKQREADFDNVIANYFSSSSYPVRRCNQLGEWEDVDNIYRSGIIADKDHYNDSFYYNNENNFWHRVYYDTANGRITSQLIPSIDTTNSKYADGYCERLVCRELGIDNLFQNIYRDERAYNGQTPEKAYKSWQHIGGARWQATSAPRNSTDRLTLTGFINNNVSQNINNVYSLDSTNLPYVEDNYKHIKKVYGVCETDFGYYNRGTQFDFKDFDSQLTQIKNATEDVDINGKAENPRAVTLHDEENLTGKTRPSRSCTSTGLWTGVSNACYRGCEMINIYNMNFTEDMYSNNRNLTDSNYYIEADNIVSIDLSMDPKVITEFMNAKKEERFELLNLTKIGSTLTNGTIIGDKNTGGFYYGDYLTGGAYWPRTIVSQNSPIETSGPKAGLRYVTVYGTCDSNYYTDENSSDIRQFVISGNTLGPSRKCYEDGSWGPIIDPNARCVLYKNCPSFYFTLENLKTLIELYNDGADLKTINEAVSGMALYNSKQSAGSCSENSIKNCNIYSFTAINSNTSNSLSENPVPTLLTNGYYNSSKNAICNLSQTENDVTSGWSLKTKNIDEYFIPKTCGIRSFGEDINYDNDITKKLVEYNPAQNNSTYYSKETKLNYVYDNLKYNSYRMDPICNMKGLEFTSSGNCTNSKDQEDETYKAVTIGNKTYNSFQRIYYCNSDKYFNELNGAVGSTTYYRKPIVFECSNGNFKHYNEVSGNKKTSMFITPDDCKPKTCGGSGSIYQPSWTISYIDGSPSPNTDNVINIRPNYSELKCDAGYAFVLKENQASGVTLDHLLNKEIGTNNKLLVPYKSSYSSDGYKSYASRGFIQTLRANCVNNQDGKINGEHVGADTYDYFRYGSLDLTDLLEVEFCTDVAKTKCYKISELDLQKGNDFKKKYCVPMACPYKNLQLVNENNTISIQEVSSGGFSLKNENNDPVKYKFGQRAIIKSFSDDSYFIKKLNKFPRPDYVMSQYGTGGGVNVCENGKDIYNEGIPNYSFSDYTSYYNNNSKVVDEIFSCIDLLETGTETSIEKVSGSCSNNFTFLTTSSDGKKICADYGENYETKKSEIDNLQTLYDSLLIKIDKNDVNSDMADYIVNKLLFSGIEYVGGSNSVLSEKIKSIAKDIEEKAKKSAVEYVNNIFKQESSSDLDGAINCVNSKWVNQLYLSQI